MCNPAFAPAITGAFAGTLKAGAENSAAMAVWRWKKNLEEFGTDNALDAMRTQYTQTALRQGQERMSRGQELAMIAKKAAAVKAAATVRAAKGGVSGASVDALQNQFEKDARESMGIRVVEGEWADSMTEQRRTAIRQQAQSRIESVQAPPEPTSSSRFANTLTQAISGAIQAHQMSSGIEPAIAPATPTGSVAPYNPIATPADIGVTNVYGAPPSSALSGLSLDQAMALRPLPTPPPAAYGKIATLGTTGANPVFPSANLGVPMSPLPPAVLPSALDANPISPLSIQQRPFEMFHSAPIGPLSSFGPLSPFFGGIY
tara:strand:- start:4257 stop:5207 length:951 start_codon:yes stop_codon:yes gene_type:complete